MSKFFLDVLNLCKAFCLCHSDPEVVLGEVFGEGVTMARVNKGILVSLVDSIVGAVKKIGWLIVQVV